ncbi:MAG: hypothetical protein ACE5MK_08995 [Acidobacteriota bacterium]
MLDREVVWKFSEGDEAKVQRTQEVAANEIIVSPDDTIKCDQEAHIHSINSNTRTEIAFINKLDSRVNVYWIDFAGARKLYSKLAPNGRVDLITFLTHPWVITDATDRCLGLVLPQETPTRVVLAD